MSSKNIGIHAVMVIMASTAMLAFAFSISSPAFAKKVSKDTGKSLYDSCLIESDNTDSMGPGLDAPNTYTCCSKSLGYCVECSKTSHSCEKFPVRDRRTSPNTKTNAPGSKVALPTGTVRDHRNKMPIGNTVVPK